MRVSPPLRLSLLSVLVLICMLAGCALLPGRRSPESHYYVLTLPHETLQTKNLHTITGPHVGIGPVTLPGYLDRRQIFVRRDNATDVSISEYSRWGESLNDGASRLLAEALSTNLASIGGTASPVRTGSAFDSRFSVDINRFDGAPGYDVALDANWTLLTVRGDVLQQGHFIAKVQADPYMDGLVRAHGKLLQQLGQVLTDAVTQQHGTSRAKK